MRGQQSKSATVSGILGEAVAYFRRLRPEQLVIRGEAGAGFSQTVLCDRPRTRT
ncbi:MAG: hypothetical protein QOF84_1070 [Streptomyces sp.]|jgi:hypothetical protein|nr:hypothetical protein [Streptomyces sp.]